MPIGCSTTTDEQIGDKYSFPSVSSCDEPPQDTELLQALSQGLLKDGPIRRQTVQLSRQQKLRQRLYLTPIINCQELSHASCHFSTACTSPFPYPTSPAWCLYQAPLSSASCTGSKCHARITFSAKPPQLLQTARRTQSPAWVLIC